MIVLERFIYGLFNNTGYKAIYSPQAKKLLTKEALEELKKMQLQKGQSSATVTVHWPSEDVVTRSYLQATKDVYGRDGILNHTVILRTSDFFQEFPQVLDVAFNLIKDNLIMNLSDPPETLEPLEVKRK